MTKVTSENPPRHGSRSIVLSPTAHNPYRFNYSSEIFILFYEELIVKKSGKRAWAPVSLQASPPMSEDILWTPTHVTMHAFSKPCHVTVLCIHTCKIKLCIEEMG